MYFHGQDLTGKRIRQGCGLKEKRSLEIEPGLLPRGILPEWLAQEWVETQSQPTRRRAGCNLACCEAGRQPGLVSSPLQGQPQHKHTQLWSLYLHCSAQLTSPLRWSLHISVCVSHTHTHTHTLTHANILTHHLFTNTNAKRRDKCTLKRFHSWVTFNKLLYCNVSHIQGFPLCRGTIFQMILC